MLLTRRLKRLVAVLLLGAIAFTHASVGFAACEMERGMLGGSLGTTDGTPCDCEAAQAKHWTKFANRCVAHCTADLQLAAAPVAMACSAADAPVLQVPRTNPILSLGIGLQAPPPGTPPPRILLHSFLI